MAPVSSASGRDLLFSSRGSGRGRRPHLPVLVADAGDAYGWLTSLERNGTIPGDLSTPGYLKVYRLGGTVSVYSDQVESPRPGAAMRVIQREGEALKAEIDSQGSVTPTPLRQALDNAAAICADGGFVIDWNA